MSTYQSLSSPHQRAVGASAPILKDPDEIKNKNKKTTKTKCLSRLEQISQKRDELLIKMLTTDVTSVLENVSQKSPPQEVSDGKQDFMNWDREYFNPTPTHTCLADNPLITRPSGWTRFMDNSKQMITEDEMFNLGMLEGYPQRRSWEHIEFLIADYFEEMHPYTHIQRDEITVLADWNNVIGRVVTIPSIMFRLRYWRTINSIDYDRRFGNSYSRKELIDLFGPRPMVRFKDFFQFVYSTKYLGEIWRQNVHALYFHGPLRGIMPYESFERLYHEHGDQVENHPMWTDHISRSEFIKKRISSHKRLFNGGFNPYGNGQMFMKMKKNRNITEDQGAGPVTKDSIIAAPSSRYDMVVATLDEESLQSRVVDPVTIEARIRQFSVDEWFQAVLLNNPPALLSSSSLLRQTNAVRDYGRALTPWSNWSDYLKLAEHLAILSSYKTTMQGYSVYRRLVVPKMPVHAASKCAKKMTSVEGVQVWSALEISLVTPAWLAYQRVLFRDLEMYLERLVTLAIGITIRSSPRGIAELSKALVSGKIALDRLSAFDARLARKMAALASGFQQAVLEMWDDVDDKLKECGSSGCEERKLARPSNRLLTALRILLLRAGVERNPGPDLFPEVELLHECLNPVIVGFVEHKGLALVVILDSITVTTVYDATLLYSSLCIANKDMGVEAKPKLSRFDPPAQCRLESGEIVFVTVLMEWRKFGNKPNAQDPSFAREMYKKRKDGKEKKPSSQSPGSAFTVQDVKTMCMMTGDIPQGASPGVLNLLAYDIIRMTSRKLCIDMAAKNGVELDPLIEPPPPVQAGQGKSKSQGTRYDKKVKIMQDTEDVVPSENHSNNLGKAAVDKKSQDQARLMDRASYIASSILDEDELAGWLWRNPLSGPLKRAVVKLWGIENKKEEGFRSIHYDYLKMYAHSDQPHSLGDWRGRAEHFAYGCFPVKELDVVFEVAGAQNKFQPDGYAIACQAAQNSLMHALEGNTTSSKLPVSGTLMAGARTPSQKPGFSVNSYDSSFVSASMQPLFPRSSILSQVTSPYTSLHVPIGDFEEPPPERIFLTRKPGQSKLLTRIMEGLELKETAIMGKIMEDSQSGVFKSIKDQPMGSVFPSSDLARAVQQSDPRSTLNIGKLVLMNMMYIHDWDVINDVLDRSQETRATSFEILGDVEDVELLLSAPAAVIDRTGPADEAGVRPQRITSCFPNGAVGDIAFSLRLSDVDYSRESKVFVLPTDAILASSDPAAVTAALITLVCRPSGISWRLSNMGVDLWPLSGSIDPGGMESIHIVFPGRNPAVDERKVDGHIAKDLRAFARWGPVRLDVEAGDFVNPAPGLGIPQLEEIQYEVYGPNSRGKIYPLAPYLHSWAGMLSRAVWLDALSILCKVARGGLFVEWAVDSLGYLLRTARSLTVHNCALPGPAAVTEQVRMDQRLIPTPTQEDQLLYIPEFNHYAWNALLTGIKRIDIDEGKTIPGVAMGGHLIQEVTLRARLIMGAADLEYRLLGIPSSMYNNLPDDLSARLSTIYAPSSRTGGKCSIMFDITHNLMKAAGVFSLHHGSMYHSALSTRIRPIPILQLHNTIDWLGQEVDGLYPTLMTDLMYHTVFANTLTAFASYHQNPVGSEMTVMTTGTESVAVLVNNEKFYSLPIDLSDSKTPFYLENSVYRRGDNSVWNTYLMTWGAYFRRVPTRPVVRNLLGGIPNGRYLRVGDVLVRREGPTEFGEMLFLTQASRAFCGLNAFRERIEYFVTSQQSRMDVAYFRGLLGYALPYSLSPEHFYIPSTNLGDIGTDSFLSGFGSAQDFQDALPLVKVSGTTEEPPATTTSSTLPDDAIL